MRELAGAILNEFWSQHNKAIKEVAKVFQQAEEPSPEATEQLLKPFQSFDLEELRDRFMSTKEGQQE